MLDIKLFRENSDLIRQDHDKRGISHVKIDEVIDLDNQWRMVLKEQNEARKTRNSAGHAISSAKKSGDQAEIDRVMEEVGSLGKLIEELDEKASGRKC